MSGCLAYERTLHDQKTHVCYEIEGYVDGEGEFLHYLLFVNDDQRTFADEDTMIDFIRTDIEARRGQA